MHISKKPREYETNRANFCGKSFYIDERAYIPNLETEQLVDIVAKELNNPKVIVDVGTGTGCIAICLAEKFPNAKIYAVDADNDALAVAQKNIETHKTKNVVIDRSNYVNNLKIPEPDAVVANLPWGDENHLLKSNPLEKLKFEPPAALFHPKGILGAYEELIISILQRNWKTVLYFESGVIPKEKVSKIIPQNSEWEYFPMTDYSVSKIMFT